MLLRLKKVKNVKEGWIPCDEDTVKQYNKQSIDDEIFCEYKPRRNYQFHKKFYAMVGLIFDNQTTYKSVENIITECKYDAGYYDIHITHNGDQRLIPKSISFATMDGDEFEDFYNSAIDTCLRLVPMGKTELETAVLRFR